MSKAAPPKFVLFVRSVEGHLVSRPDGGGQSYFGARVATFEERAAGSANILWDTAQVIPLSDVFVANFSREISEWLRSGGLVKVDSGAYEAWLEFEAARDEAAQPKPALPPIPEDSALTEHEQPAEAPAAEETK